MKDWITYLCAYHNSNIWGHVFLDYYQKMKENGDHRSPVTFLHEEIPKILHGVTNPVAFHRVLVCVCVQLLGDDFDEIFARSVETLESFRESMSADDIDAVAEHYEVYAKKSMFLSRLASEGLIPSSSARSGDRGGTALINVRVSKSDEALGTSAGLGDLDRRVKQAIQQVSLGEGTFEDEGYDADFRRSAEEKADDLLEEIRRERLSENRVAVLSIGGADGTELERVLLESDVRHGALLELRNMPIEIAHEKSRNLAAKTGKQMKVFEGDATQKLAECVKFLQKLREDGKIDGLVCSMHAILHELPDRSPGFDLQDFVHTIVDSWSPFLVYLREPCKQSGWPARIQIKCPYVQGKTLMALAREVALRTGFDRKTKMKSRTEDYVEMPANLAAEVLFKLFHIEALAHELEERVTHFSPKEIHNSLARELGQAQIHQSDANSNSFDRFYREYQISCRNDRGEEQMIPTVFVRIVGFRA